MTANTAAQKGGYLWRAVALGRAACGGTAAPGRGGAHTESGKRDSKDGYFWREVARSGRKRLGVVGGARVSDCCGLRRRAEGSRRRDERWARKLECGGGGGPVSLGLVASKQRCDEVLAGGVGSSVQPLRRAGVVGAVELWGRPSSAVAAAVCWPRRSRRGQAQTLQPYAAIGCRSSASLPSRPAPPDAPGLTPRSLRPAPALMRRGKRPCCSVLCEVPGTCLPVSS